MEWKERVTVTVIMGTRRRRRREEIGCAHLVDEADVEFFAARQRDARKEQHNTFLGEQSTAHSEEGQASALHQQSTSPFI